MFALRIGGIALIGVGLSLSLVHTGPASAEVIEVPGDQPTIQAAIDAAADGDTVLVAPGTYFENINFLGKAITVTSEDGPEATIINGGSLDTVVTFDSDEGPDSVINGLTIRNGDSGRPKGDGINIDFASPTVTNNRIVDNNGCFGMGIQVDGGEPLIRYNEISRNIRGGCSGSGGGGINLGFSSNAQILDNIISDNVVTDGNGGGILIGGGSPLIRGNLITGNSVSGLSPASVGGGIDIGSSEALITQNVIFNNMADRGAGIAWNVGPTARGPRIIGNTILGMVTIGGDGSAIYAAGWSGQVELRNNIIVGDPGQWVIYCDDTRDTTPPTIEFNNVFTESPTFYGGFCEDQTGLNGNISEDPIFIDIHSDLRLQEGSPAIDAGDNSEPDLFGTDFDRRPRLLDGDGDAVAVVDMGAYEFGEAPDLALTGTCPGTVDIAVSGATPSSPVALLRSASEGAIFLPGGACGGALLGLSPPTLMGAKLADAQGDASFAGNFPAAACELVLQAFDVATCTPSNVAQMP